MSAGAENAARGESGARPENSASPESPARTQKAAQFQELRPLLFSIAYRVLGTVTEAEDAVQETWLRYDATPAEPRSARAFLSTTVTRVAIDVLRSARVRREAYVGPWLPEPLLTDPYEDPARAAELADSVSLAALLLLERLTPLERAVFVLREVFDFPFPEVAEAVGRSEPACRQLAVRARRHMSADRPRFTTTRTARDELAARFFEALREGDVLGLRGLLADGVTVLSDSGGKAPRLARPVEGAVSVSRLFGAVFPRMAGIGVTAEPRTLNGGPGAVFRDAGGRVLHTMGLDVEGDRIAAIRLTINPDKLRHIGPVADVWAVDRAFRRTGRS